MQTFRSIRSVMDVDRQSILSLALDLSFPLRHERDGTDDEGSFRAVRFALPPMRADQGDHLNRLSQPHVLRHITHQ